MYFTHLQNHSKPHLDLLFCVHHKQMPLLFPAHQDSPGAIHTQMVPVVSATVFSCSSCCCCCCCCCGAAGAVERATLKV